jgi:hypothetical protein
MRTTTLLITVSALTAAAPLAAQNGNGGGEISLKGGLAFANVSNKGILPGELSGRNGFALGLGAHTGGLLGLGIEGLFSQQGVVGVGAQERKLDYVDVPAYLRLTLPTPGVRPFAFAGPQVSFEIRCRSGSIECADADRKKTNYAGIIGAGIRIGSHGGLSIEGRYVYGLTDLKLGTVTSSESYKTRSFLLLAGITF